jgi:hypothetical protein
VVIFVLLVVAGISAVAGLRYWWTSRERDASSHPLPPLLYPLPASLQQQPPVHGNGAPRPVEAPVVRPIAVEPPRPVETPVARPVAVEPRMNYRPAARPVESDHDNTETVRFVRPSVESVQLLPGRLEVLEGATPHKEIRFVRIPGEPVQVILGREVGLTPHYIGLGSPTVSRRHARFDFADNRWSVKNLSRTNPLVVNDDELFDTDIARPLADGDRLELGEVVLRFHAH